MKSLTRNTLLAAVALATAGCASEPSTSTDICGQIAQFANSSDRSVHWVELTGDHRCESDGYQPGAKLCQYLTATGTPDTHRRGALECLRDTDMIRYDGRDAPYPVTIRYTSRLAMYTDRLVMVRIEYPADAKPPASLRISAQKLTAWKQSLAE